jgi:hypothetical protein
MILSVSRVPGKIIMINAGTIMQEKGRCVSVADFSQRTVTFYPFVDGIPSEPEAYQKTM